MWSGEQIRYLEEVLGASAEYFRGGESVSVSDAVSVSACAVSETTAVVTPSLSGEEKALLTKILASAQLKEFEHFEGEASAPASHVIRFQGEPLGRQLVEASVHWRLPLLSEMLGSGPLVTEKKKYAWTLLQQFMRERQQ